MSAYSTISYTGNGVTTVFNVPFGYINQSDVLVTVSGQSVAYTWISSTQIQFTSAPANGAAVLIDRNTSLTNPSVTFADGSTLRASDLNTNLTQVLYGLQEDADAVTLFQNAQLVAGNLPVVTTANNTDLLQVVAGVWTIVTPTQFRTNTALFPLTTKGDLYTRSASADARLAVGANNTTLLADSTQTNGVKWAFQPVADTSLSTGASGMAVQLNAASGLQVSGGGLHVLSGNSAINVAAGGVSVVTAANGGLNISTGLLVRGCQVVSADPGSPADGDQWYNSTTKTFRSQEAGVTVGRCGKISATVTDGTIVTNTITDTSGGSVTIPANFLTAGKVIRILYHGSYNSTAAPNLTISLFKGAVQVEGGTFVAGGSRFHGEFYLTIRTAGAGGTLVEGGWIIGEFNGAQLVQNFGQSATTAIDTTVSNTFSIHFQWGTAAAGNSVHLTQLILEVMD